MQEDVLPIVIKALMPTANGSAVFLGDANKTFVMHIDAHMGGILASYIQNERPERPMTHDLMGTVFEGLGIALEHVIINNVSEGVFYSRLILVMRNELGTKMVEIDSRPSDALVLALQADTQIFVGRSVYDKVEDMTAVLEKILDEGQGENSLGDNL